MGFFLRQLSSGNKIESDGKGGNLSVISGKGRPASSKAWKDEGAVKKGDTIEGIEFTCELKNRGNIVAQTYDASTKKFTTSTVPVSDTFKATIFIPGDNGLSYLKVLSSLELSQKIGILPAIADKPLIDGFAGVLMIGESSEVAAVMSDDWSKPERIKMFLFDEFEPKDCNLEFSVATTGYKGGGSTQSEKDKLGDRVNFIQAVLTDSSVEQQLFVKLLAVDATITYKEFINLMFQ